MKKNKLVVICNSTNPDLVEYFKCKVNALNNSEFRNICWFFKNKSIDLDSDRICNSSLTRSAFFDKKVLLDFFISFYLCFLVLKNKVNVVHFTTAHISNLFLSILLKPFNIKQIFTIHDLLPHPGKKAKFINAYNKLVINFLSDEIISFSKNEIKKQFNRNKFKYLPLSGFEQCIDTSKVGEKTILFVGRIEPYKGLKNLLDLIVKINTANLNYKFIIAGKGNIENIEEFYRFNNVKVINRFITDNEMYSLFKKATFTILPYDSATQSGVTILSYSYATPVIAYDVGALAEYIENKKNGFIIPYKDNDSIVNILRDINMEHILKLSQNSISSFKEKYSKDACENYYLEYYGSLLDE